MLEGMGKTASIVDTAPEESAGLGFLVRESVGKVALEVPGQTEQGGTAVLSTAAAVPVHARISGRVEGASLLVHSLSGTPFSVELSMKKVATEEDVQVFETPYQPSGNGVFQLSVRTRDPEGREQPSAAGLRVIGVDPVLPIAVFLDPEYTREQKAELFQVFEKVFAKLGVDANYVDMIDRDMSFLPDLFARLEEGTAVVWLSDLMSKESRASLLAFFHRRTRLLLVSRRPGFTFSSGLGTDLLHARSNGLARNKTLRSTIPGVEQQEFVRTHVALEPIPPATPILLNSLHQPAGLQVDTDDTRVFYLGFDLHDLPEEICYFLLDAGLRFLLQGTETVELSVAGHRDPHWPLVVTSADELPVRLKVDADIDHTYLTVRSLPGQELTEVILLLREGEREGKQVFSGRLTIAESGQYELVPRLVHADGRELFADRRLRLLRVDTEKTALVVEYRRFWGFPLTYSESVSR